MSLILSHRRFSLEVALLTRRTSARRPDLGSGLVYFAHDLQGHRGNPQELRSKVLIRASRLGTGRWHDACCFGSARRIPTMKCADIMNKNVETLNEQDSVQKAALVMAETGVGFLPICDARMHVIGVVTDRDLTTRAALVMTSPALTCLATADVREAEELMANERKARLIIVDADGRLAGVLSLADLVEHAPGRQTLQTVSAVLWREALGPRGGATKNQPLLKDDPVARNLPVPSDDLKVRPSVFAGGNRIRTRRNSPADQAPEPASLRASSRLGVNRSRRKHQPD